MKKIFLTMIAVLLMVSFVLCSCGEKENENDNGEVADNELDISELFGDDTNE